MLLLIGLLFYFYQIVINRVVVVIRVVVNQVVVIRVVVNQVVVVVVGNLVVVSWVGVAINRVVVSGPSTHVFRCVHASL